MEGKFTKIKSLTGKSFFSDGDFKRVVKYFEDIDELASTINNKTSKVGHDRHSPHQQFPVHYAVEESSHGFRDFRGGRTEFHQIDRAVCGFRDLAAVMVALAFARISIH